MKGIRLTWRRQPSETGLRSIGQGPRGAILRMTVKSADGDRDSHDVARVSAYRIRLGVYRGWSWVAGRGGTGIPWRNTSETPVDDLEEAKRACLEYVRACLENSP